MRSTDFSQYRFTYLVALLAIALEGIASIFVICTTLAAVHRLYCCLPYGDMWWFVRDMSLYRDHRIGLAFLWQQHSEHRIALPRLIFWIDLHFSRFQGIFTIVCGFLFQAGEALLLCFAFWRMEKSNFSSRLAYSVLVFSMMFSASQIENLIFPFQVQFPLAFFMASLSIFFILRHCEIHGGNSIFLFLGLVAAACSTLSLGCGLLVWPALLLICVIERGSLKAMFTISIAGVGMWICYFIGYYSPSANANPWVSLTHPVSVVRFAFTFLGSVLSSGQAHFTSVLALSLLAFTAIFLAFYVCTQPYSFRRVPPLFIYLSLYILATSFLTALGRINYGLPEASAIRYRMPVLIFWACILGLLLSVWNGSANHGVRTCGSTIVGLLFVAIVLAPVQQSTIESFASLSAQLRDDSVALAFDVGDEVYARLFNLRPDLVRSYAPFLRENNLSIFADRLFTARGKSLTTLFVGGLRQECFGSFEGLRPLQDMEAPEGTAFGWGWIQAESRGPETVILADENKTIVGLANGLAIRPDVAESFHNRKMLAAGWSGYYHAAPTSRAISAYALLSDGDTLCSLGQLAVEH